ncbi:MAG: CCA tRNA nucleotidyltransferase, partial [Terriglobales bacterium]
RAAGRIVDRLRGAGYQALYAGGAVRDRLLGRPAHDFDVATDATPESVMRLFPHHSAVGAQFGVVLVHEPEGTIEVATFRTEASYADGRHPEGVRYTRSAREDVLRRDFTINGLLLDPESGEVVDYVGGRADLEAGLIRAIGAPERRFGEDRLRLLRAVRFAARLGFSIETATLEAMQRQAGEIVAISAERIRDEILKMLTEGQARTAFELLDRTGLLAPVLPEIAALHGVEQPPQFHPEGDVWTHTLMMLERLPHPVAPALALGVLLHDVGKPKTFRRAPDRIRFNGHAEIGAAMAAAIAQRLRLANADAELVVALVADHMKWPELPNMRESTRKRFLRRPDIEAHLMLAQLDCAASHGDTSLVELARQQLCELSPEELRPARLITGDDLIGMGYRPGPQFHAILEAVEDAQLEGRLGDAASARQFVSERYAVAH